ncbi:MAG: SIS domain-containing protein [Opitutales bacterium]
MSLTFPHQLDRIRDNALAQEATLQEVARIYADALLEGGVVHIYANGHSRISVEEVCIRMGALTGFHALLTTGLVTFTDVIGMNGIRVNQQVEKVEGLAAKMLDEISVAPGEPLLVVTATGTTQAAVDMALEFNRRYPDNPLIALACAEQSREAPTKHSSGKNLWHVVEEARRGIFLDNGMPMGDLSVHLEGGDESYAICPLSSIGALTIIQSLNELTLREILSRGESHPVLRNMHLGGYGVNYDEWLADQRRRYARTLHNPEALTPATR